MVREELNMMGSKGREGGTRYVEIAQTKRGRKNTRKNRDVADIVDRIKK